MSLAKFWWVFGEVSLGPWQSFMTRGNNLDFPNLGCRSKYRQGKIPVKVKVKEIISLINKNNLDLSILGMLLRLGFVLIGTTPFTKRVWVELVFRCSPLRHKIIIR